MAKRPRGVRIDPCPWGHGHPMSQGMAECNAAWRALVAQTGWSKHTPPCCGHDPLFEHERGADGNVWCQRCSDTCPALEEVFDAASETRTRLE